MADPLGFISGPGSAGAFRPESRVAPSRDASQPSFKDVLMNNIREVNSLQQDASKAIEDLQAGRRTDMEGVILATQKADTAFRMLQSVRNRVMEAYEEIKQIRV
ncbi:MAG: flagellar hook-basal body complex protein FliE [Planctomycetota bacterium]|nr:flagellar hook-basal body complex protein FliE [Planctomycetota bacterium]